MLGFARHRGGRGFRPVPGRPGVLTPSDCFKALRNGTDGLKFFPSSLVGPKGLAAIRAVLPLGTETYAVGGAGPETFGAWFDAGVSGFGIGSDLYKPGLTAQQFADRAGAIVTRFDDERRRRAA